MGKAAGPGAADAAERGDSTVNTFLRIDINLLATLYLGIVFSLAYRRLDHENRFNILYFRACVMIMALTAGEALTCVINARPTPALVVVSTIIHMVHNPGTAARLFSALSHARVNVRMIDQGSSELSILVGVDRCDFEASIRAIYDEFVH